MKRRRWNFRAKPELAEEATVQTPSRTRTTVEGGADGAAVGACRRCNHRASAAIATSDAAIVVAACRWACLSGKAIDGSINLNCMNNPLRRSIRHRAGPGSHPGVFSPHYRPSSRSLTLRESIR